MSQVFFSRISRQWRVSDLSTMFWILKTSSLQQGWSSMVHLDWNKISLLSDPCQILTILKQYSYFSPWLLIVDLSTLNISISFCLASMRDEGLPCLLSMASSYFCSRMHWVSFSLYLAKIRSLFRSRASILFVKGRLDLWSGVKFNLI